VIAKVGPYVFGGFSPISWCSRDAYVDAQGKSWLFSLKNPSSTRAKIPNVAGSGNGASSILDKPNYGPTFGGGHDLYLADQCNANSSSYSNLSHDYSGAKWGLTYGSTAQTFFAGSYTFTVSEYEVYSINM